MALFVNMPVVFSLLQPVSPGRYHRPDILGLGLGDEAVGVISPVGKQIISLQARNQGAGRNDIVFVSWRQMDSEWVPEPIYDSVDFCG